MDERPDIQADLTDFPPLPDDIYSYKSIFDYSVWQAGSQVTIYNSPIKQDYSDIFDVSGGVSEALQARNRLFSSIPIQYRKTLTTSIIYGDSGIIKLPIPYSVARPANYLVLKSNLPPAVPENSVPERQYIYDYYFHIVDIAYLAPNTTTFILSLDYWMTFAPYVAIKSMQLHEGHAAMMLASKIWKDDFSKPPSQRPQDMMDFLYYAGDPEDVDLGNGYDTTSSYTLYFGSQSAQVGADLWYLYIQSKTSLVKNPGDTSNPNVVSANGSSIQGIPVGVESYLIAASDALTFFASVGTKPWVAVGILSCCIIPSWMVQGLGTPKTLSYYNGVTVYDSPNIYNQRDITDLIIGAAILEDVGFEVIGNGFMPILNSDDVIYDYSQNGFEKLALDPFTRIQVSHNGNYDYYAAQEFMSNTHFSNIVDHRNPWLGFRVVCEMAIVDGSVNWRFYLTNSNARRGSGPEGEPVSRPLQNVLNTRTRYPGDSQNRAIFGANFPSVPIVADLYILALAQRTPIWKATAANAQSVYKNSIAAANAAYRSTVTSAGASVASAQVGYQAQQQVNRLNYQNWNRTQNMINQRSIASQYQSTQAQRDYNLDVAQQQSYNVANPGDIFGALTQFANNGLGALLNIGIPGLGGQSINQTAARLGSLITTGNANTWQNQGVSPAYNPTVAGGYQAKVDYDTSNLRTQSRITRANMRADMQASKIMGQASVRQAEIAAAAAISNAARERALAKQSASIARKNSLRMISAERKSLKTTEPGMIAGFGGDFGLIVWGTLYADIQILTVKRDVLPDIINKFKLFGYSCNCIVKLDDRITLPGYNWPPNDKLCWHEFIHPGEGTYWHASNLQFDAPIQGGAYRFDLPSDILDWFEALFNQGVRVWRVPSSDELQPYNGSLIGWTYDKGYLNILDKLLTPLNMPF